MAVNGIGMGGDGDQAHLTDEERKAAALRVIRRAKRMALPGRDRAYSTCETGQFPQAIGGKQPPVPHKNSRKSRSGFGRGLPKKGKFQNLDRRKHLLRAGLLQGIFYQTNSIFISLIKPKCSKLFTAKFRF